MHIGSAVIQADATTHDGRPVRTWFPITQAMMPSLLATDPWDIEADTKAAAIARFDQLCAGTGTTIDEDTITMTVGATNAIVVFDEEGGRDASNA